MTDNRLGPAAVQRVVLANGLTVLVEHCPTAPVVSVVTHVRAGYFDEPDAWTGIAHVMEHMFFTGSARYGPGDMARAIRELGGSVNAGTIYDRTVYYAVLPSTDDGLTKAVELQADALMHAALDPEQLARELEVIVQESRRKQDSPPAVTTETLYGQLFRRHRMRRWRIGTAEGLRRLTAQDLREYYESRYTPSRTILALVGDLDVDAALDLARRTYESWSRPPGEIPESPPESDPPPPNRRILRGDVERPQVALGWRTVGTLHPDAPVLDVAAGILGWGRASWLSRAIREPGLAGGVGARHYTPTEIGVFDVSLSGEARHLDDAVETALELVNGLGHPGPTPEDVRRVVALDGVRWARRLETMDGRGATWCAFEALGGLHLAEALRAATERVTPDDVQAVADRYLGAARATMTGFLPSGTDVEDGSWPPMVARIRPPPIPAGPEDGSTTNTVRGPRVKDRTPGSALVRSLPGADILVQVRPGAGLVHIDLLAPGVREEETADSAGSSALLIRTALRGAGSLSGAAMAARAEGLGGSIAPILHHGAAGWGMTVRPENVSAAVALIYRIVSNPGLATSDVAIERDLLASDARRSRDDMFHYPIQRVLEVLFPGTAYGLPALGDPDRVGGFTTTMITEWHRRLTGRRLAVMLVGDGTKEELLQAADRFGSWPEAPGPVAAAPAGPPATGRFAETRHKAQSALAMGFPAPPRGDPARASMLVLGSLLGGMGGRLFAVLRERRSLAYSVSALSWQRRSVGAMLTYVATAPEREEEAREGMLTELAGVATGPLPAEDLHRAKNHVIGSIALRRQSAGALAADCFEEWWYGEAEGPDNTAAQVQAVTEQQIRELAERIFVREQRAEFVLRGATGGG